MTQGQTSRPPSLANRGDEPRTTPEAMRGLIVLLDDPAEAVRNAAFSTLRDYGTDAEPALKRLVAPPPDLKEVRWLVQATVRRPDGPGPFARPKPWATRPPPP